MTASLSELALQDVAAGLEMDRTASREGIIARAKECLAGWRQADQAVRSIATALGIDECAPSVAVVARAAECLKGWQDATDALTKEKRVREEGERKLEHAQAELAERQAALTELRASAADLRAQVDHVVQAADIATAIQGSVQDLAVQVLLTSLSGRADLLASADSTGLSAACYRVAKDFVDKGFQIRGEEDEARRKTEASAPADPRERRG